MITKLKEKIKEAFAKHKKNVGWLLLGAAFILIVSFVSNKTNDELMGTNKELRTEMLRDKMRIELMYYIIGIQADSLSMYKTRLINCQETQITNEGSRTK